MDSGGDTACAVGCPIRKSADQSLLAAPHSLSQRAASFIASQCQGIHQMPFRRLILFSGCATRRGQPWRTRNTARCIRPSNQPAGGRPEVRPRSLNNRLHTVHDPAPVPPQGEPRSSRCRVAFPSDGSLPEPTASTPEWSGGGRRDRTDDLLLAKQALSQLSYAPCRYQAVPPDGWWAREDLNLRPHAYQARALTN